VADKPSVVADPCLANNTTHCVKRGEAPHRGGSRGNESGLPRHRPLLAAGPIDHSSESRHGFRRVPRHQPPRNWGPIELRRPVVALWPAPPVRLDAPRRAACRGDHRSRFCLDMGELLASPPPDRSWKIRGAHLYQPTHNPQVTLPRPTRRKSAALGPHSLARNQRSNRFRPPWLACRQGRSCDQLLQERPFHSPEAVRLLFRFSLKSVYEPDIAVQECDRRSTIPPAFAQACAESPLLEQFGEALPVSALGLQRGWMAGAMEKKRRPLFGLAPGRNGFSATRFQCLPIPEKNTTPTPTLKRLLEFLSPNNSNFGLLELMEFIGSYWS